MFNIKLSIYSVWEKQYFDFAKNIYIVDFVNCNNLDDVIFDFLIDIKNYII